MVHQMGPAPQQFRELELGRLFFDDAGVYISALTG